MSTSRSPALPGISKKISSWVRPGVCEVRARLLRPVSALIREDLPTLERPAKAISRPAIGGRVSIEGEAQTNCQSPANSFRPASISFASMSPVMRRTRPRHCRAKARSASSRRVSRPSTSLQSLPSKMWMPGTRRGMTNEGTSAIAYVGLRLRLGLLPNEGRLDVVEQLNLHAVAAHDEALLQHREQVVPGPVDHEPGREARQHEREDQRH